MEKEIMNQIDKTNKEVSQLISSLDKEEFNTIPFEGSWTPAQVADHIIKFQSGMAELIKGKVERTSRQPGDKIPRIKEIFLDFNLKMKSPEFVEPGDLPLQKDEVLKKLSSISLKIQQTAFAQDLSMTCLDFELPGFGPMTRLEWLHFLLYHTQRHIHQLKNIRERLSAKTQRYN